MGRFSSAAEAKAAGDLRYAKRGLITGAVAGMSYGMVATLGDIALEMDPMATAIGALTAGLVLASMQMLLGGVWVTIFNFITGRQREVFRALNTKPGKIVMLGSLFGGVLAMIGFWVGLSMAPLGYVLAISALFPIIGALFAGLMLKEKIKRRVWMGVILAVAGAIIVSWAPPEGEWPLFYMGLVFCSLAALGWGIEGVIATFGMDMIDPAIAVNIRELTAGTVFIIIIFPILVLTGGNPFVVIGQLFTEGVFNGVIVLVLLCTVFQAVTDLTWYHAMNRTGVARAMALNITYVFWGIVFGFFLSLFIASLPGVELNPLLVTGAVLILAGVVLVIANPRELLNLRKR